MLPLNFPLAAVHFVDLRVGVILSVQAELLERALRNFSRVPRLPGPKDIKGTAHFEPSIPIADSMAVAMRVA